MQARKIYNATDYLAYFQKELNQREVFQHFPKIYVYFQELSETFLAVFNKKYPDGQLLVFLPGGLHAASVVFDAGRRILRLFRPLQVLSSHRLLAAQLEGQRLIVDKLEQLRTDQA